MERGVEMNTLNYYFEKAELIKSFKCPDTCRDCLFDESKTSQCAIWWTARRVNTCTVHNTKMV